MQSVDVIYADQSEIKIKNPKLQIVSRNNPGFLTESPQDKLLISNNEARHRNDPSINLSSNFGLTFDNEATYSRPDLNLRSPVNEIKIKKSR